MATLESPTRLDLSDDDDDESSDYFADAETSSCGSFDDEIGWCGISENKGRFLCPVKAPLSHLHPPPPLSLQSPPPNMAERVIASFFHRRSAIPTFTFHHVHVRHYIQWPIQAFR